MGSDGEGWWLMGSNVRGKGRVWGLNGKFSSSGFFRRLDEFIGNINY